MKPFESILHTIGNTPVVKLNNLTHPRVNLFVKLESFNPLGSVKDRLALAVIEDAERRGLLAPGQTIVEATSGNTGLGLAMVCAQKGYPLVITMAENFSIERRKLMRFLGAKVVLTPAHLKGSGMLAKATELAEKHGWWQPQQFDNPANAEVHARTTAQEILVDFEHLPLDYFVCGFGTGGTLNGISRVLKQQSPDTRIVVCEPDNAQLLASGIAQQRDQQGRVAASHPKFRPHLMQGWSPDFIPSLAEQAVDQANIDEFQPVNGQKALQCARDLASKEGILVGTSSGATLAGALQLAEHAQPGSNILCILADTGERYLSTPLFEDIEEQMSDEELEIAASTPGYRFDVSAPAAATVEEPEPLDESAIQEVKALTSNPEEPVVMFAMEWCEFCWSVRKMLKQYGIAYRSVDIDSVAYQQNNRGGHIRNVLKQQTGCATIPQIFIGGEFIGGCTDLFDQCLDGSLATRLDRLDIHFDRQQKTDPYSFLPKWLHPR